MTRKSRSLLSVIVMTAGLLIFFQNCSPPPDLVSKIARSQAQARPISTAATND